MTKQKTYKRKDWKCIKSITDIEPLPNGRLIIPVAVGERTLDSGEQEYIIEDMYADVLSEVYSEESSYTTMIDLHRYPAITLLYNGTLAIHNEKIKKDIENVTNIINSIDQTLMLQAFYELRLNAECLEKLGSRAKFFISLIHEQTPVKYSNSFIYAVLAKIIAEKYNNTPSEAADIIHDLSYKELLQAVCGVVEHKVTHNCTTEPIQIMVGSMRLPYKEVERNIMQELLFRLANGQIKQAKEER